MKSKNLKLSAVAGLAVLALFVIPAHAAEKATVRTGYLTCDEAGGWGLILRVLAQCSLQVHVK